MRLSVMLMVSAWALAGCSDAMPCTNCPPVDGVYAVNWGGPGTVIQGGDGGRCPTAGPRAANWTLAQTGSSVSTSIEGVRLGGTIYDSYDLVLSGSQGSINYRLRAQVIPNGTSNDAGIELRGTFTTHDARTNGDTCEVSDTFTAQRTSR